MPYLNLFDEVASIGWKFLKSTDRGHKMLQEYTFQLAAICDLIKYTHSIVIKKLEAIDEAQTVDAAKAIAQELGWGSLSSSFRASGLCDVFTGYGKSLRRITEKHQGSTDPAAAPPITVQERDQWRQFCDSLEAREAQVADLYIREIQGLQDLVSASSSQDLIQVKEHARQARAILTAQVGDFDALAVRFRQQIEVYR